MLHHTKAVAAGHAARHGRRRPAVHVVPGLPGGRRPQRRTPDQGGRRARRQARGAAARPRPPAGRDRHPGDGARGPHAAVGATAWAATGCRVAARPRTRCWSRRPNWRRRARSRSCWRRCPPTSAPRSAPRCRSPRSGSAPARHADAQVLVINDLLGLTEKPPKLAKAYVDLREPRSPDAVDGVHRATSSRARSPTRTTATRRRRLVGPPGHRS